MGQITFTLPDELEEEVRQAVREGNHGGVSDFMRSAIKNELSGRPTYWERFMIVHLLENNKILKELTQNPNTPSDELLDAMRSGYANRYADAKDIVMHDELTRSDTDFVQDVLEMYGAIQGGFDASDSDDPKLAKQVEFEGFDGNAGDGYLGFANFLADNGRFTYVRPLDKIPHLNSHSSVNSIYRRMLREYKAIKAKKDPYAIEPLTLDDVKQIVAARIHPEYRKKMEQGEV